MNPAPPRSVPRLGLNRVELAQAIGVSATSVDQMVKEGYLPPPRRWHTRKVWLLSDVEAALQAWPEDAGAAEFDTHERQDGPDDQWTAS
ncbi:hypothetical protein [Rhizobium sp. CG5]|uniref:helix-turn-helix transcriptional regulator n=1 Tax=Rhizobium sp. CG5 TaxID=2726076 RepID=UPI002034324F|nr:hypothetical protein [Rhizobium sp. CG5]